MTERFRSTLTGTLGGVFVTLGLWAAAHPPSFTVVLADFGPYNTHLVHDLAAASAAFGVGLIVSWRVPIWRTPIVASAALWNGLHALSHAADVTEARYAVVGWIELAALVAVTVVLAWLAGAPKTTTAERKGSP